MRYLLLFLLSFPAYATVFTLHDTAGKTYEGDALKVTGFFEIEQGVIKSWHLETAFLFDNARECPICGPNVAKMESPRTVHFYTNATPAQTAELRLEFDGPIAEGSRIIPGDTFQLNFTNYDVVPMGSYLRHTYYLGNVGLTSGFIAPEPSIWFAVLVGLCALCKRYVHVRVKNLRSVCQRNADSIVPCH